MKKFLAFMLCMVMVTGVLTACGGEKKDDSKPSGNESSADSGDSKDEDGSGLKVALCVTGAVNDMGWCQAAYEGLKLVEEKFGCETAYSENLDVADMAATFTDYAANGYDVVIGHGFQFGDPAVEVGEAYPDTKFICVEGGASAENVASYVMKCEETAYLNGMLAASLSKSGKIGVIGPIQGDSLVKIINGYEDGAKEVNADIEVKSAWTGSFTDTALAKEAATAMIDGGADIIGHCANECGTGAINAAAEAGIYAIGDSYDQNELAPETILVSAIYNVPQLIEAAVQDIIDENFTGEIKNLGMKEGIVELSPFYNQDAIPDEVLELVNKKAEEIKSGDFEVPCDTEPRS